MKSITLPSSVEYIGESVFDSPNFDSIAFSGTRSEWNAVEKHERWNAYIYRITVTCTDGTVVVE